MFLKVWGNNRKKAVVADNFDELLKKGKEKLDMSDCETVKVFLNDGTEIDDNETLKCCVDGTVVQFIDTSSISVEEKQIANAKEPTLSSNIANTKTGKQKQLTLTLLNDKIALGPEIAEV